MDVAQVHAHFVEACSDLQVWQISDDFTLELHRFLRLFAQVPATRAAADEVLTNFRQTPQILPACQYILGSFSMYVWTLQIEERSDSCLFRR
jgi:hypothetical protein